MTARKIPVTLEVYPDIGDQWRWRQHVGNSLTSGGSEQAYASKRNAKRAATRLARLFDPRVCTVLVVVTDG